MPTIEKVRIVNVAYAGNPNSPDGATAKQMNDLTFRLDGEHTYIQMPNGGGKTTIIHFLLSVLKPDAKIGGQLVGNRLKSNGTAHICIEWASDADPKTHFLTAVSFQPVDVGETTGSRGRAFFTMRFPATSDDKTLESFPFVREDQGEKTAQPFNVICKHYASLAKKSALCRYFPKSDSYSNYRSHLEENLHITEDFVNTLVSINGFEGAQGLADFFRKADTSANLLNRYILPFIAQKDTEEFQTLFRDARSYLSAAQKADVLKNEAGRFLGDLQAIEDNETQYYQAIQDFRNAERRIGEADATISSYLKKEEAAYEEIQRMQGELEQKVNINRAVRDALGVRLARIAMDAAQRNLSARIDMLNVASSRHHKWNSFYVNQKYRKLKDTLAGTEEQVREKEKKLADYSKTLPEDSIPKNLKETQEKLSYLYHTEIRNLDASLAKNQQGKETAEKKLLEGQKHSNDLREKISSLDQKAAGIKANIASLTKRIADRLTSFPVKFVFDVAGDTNTLIEQFNKYKIALGGTINKQESRLRMQEQAQEGIQDDIRMAEEKKQSEEQALKEMQWKLEQDNAYIAGVEAAAGDVYPQVTRFPAFVEEFQDVSGLYSNETRIREHMKREIRSLRQEMEQVKDNLKPLRSEYQPYANIDRYLVDPHGYDVIQQQISSIPSASFLLDDLFDVEDMSSADVLTLLQSHPELATSVITEDSDRERVLKLMNRIKGDINHPVTIISRKDFERILNESGNTTVSAVLPKDWEFIHPKSFQTWKNDMEWKIREQETRQQDIRKHLDNYNEAAEKISVFFTRYPREEYAEKVKDLATCQHSITSLEMNIATRAKRLDNLRKNLEDILKKAKATGKGITELKERSENLENALQAMNERGTRENELLTVKKSKPELSSMLVDAMQEEEEIRKSLQDIYSNERVYNQQRQSVMKEHCYQEVKDFTERPTDVSKDELVREYDRLVLRMEEFNASRKELAELRKEVELARQKADGLADRVKDIRQTACSSHVSIQEDFDFTPYPVGKSDGEILTQIAQYETEMKRNESERETAQEEFKLREGAYKERHRLYIDSYHKEPDTYDTISEAEARTMQEDRSRQIEDDENTLRKDIPEKARLVRRNQRALTKLQSDIASYVPKDFETVYEPIQRIDIPHLEKEVQTQLDALKKYRKAKDKADERRETVLQTFASRYPHGDLADAAKKLTNQIKGLRSIDEFQRMLTDILAQYKKYENTVKVAQMSADEQVYNVLTSYVQRLQKLRVRIENIAKATTVETNLPNHETEKTQVFEFSFPPTPSDEDALKYVGEYLKRIAQEAERKEKYGMEADLEKYLKERLAPSALFDAYYQTGNDFFVARCRKVNGESGRAFSEEFYTWNRLNYGSGTTSSNVFSGAEGWARNIILLIAILTCSDDGIYSHPKKNRLHNKTFIMDNPIGSSSSPSIINPVMAFADQMGYQMVVFSALHDPLILSKFPRQISFTKATTEKAGSILLKLDSSIHNLPGSMTTLERERTFEEETGSPLEQL